MVPVPPRYEPAYVSGDFLMACRVRVAYRKLPQGSEVWFDGVEPRGVRRSEDQSDTMLSRVF